ncbi:hypothetical protein KA107_00710 [Candidatus Pacearchaeota archaeon]|nr:hypothetical protein [Candidatus Pacearchaeota archaeon]
MKTSQKLEELLKMAETQALSQKPAEALGSLADKFIEAYAKRMPASALQNGLRLGDESLARAAAKQIAEQDYRGESLMDAYRYSLDPRTDSHLQYDLRRMALESYPEEVYKADFEEHEQKAEDADSTELWRLNRDLMESREYFAGLKPDDAIREGSKNVEGSEKDPTLIALAKPYKILQTILDSGLEKVNHRHGIESLIIAKACPNVLIREKIEEEYEKKERIAETAKLGYLAAHNTAISGLKEEATKLFAKYNLSSAAQFALKYKDPELARLVLEKLVQSEGLRFHEDTTWSSGEGNLAYQLAREHNFKDYLGKIVERIMASYPERALNWGLRHNDEYLVGEARKKLGKKVSQQAIRLFQQSSKGDKE